MNIKKNILSVLSFFTILLLAAPLIAHAGLPGVPNGKEIKIEDLLNEILKIVWPIAVTIVIIFFVLAGFKFLNAQGDPTKVADARRFVIWAIAGVIVIICGFSIVQVIQTTFFPNNP